VYQQLSIVATLSQLGYVIAMIEQFKLHLKNSGYKATPPRLAVFRYLQQHDPTTVRAVVASVSKQADRASAYRTLRLLSQLNVIKDVVIAGRHMIELSDNFDSHHHHLTCTGCGAGQSISSPQLEASLQALAARFGYAITSHQIEISGLCVSCRPPSAA
jgi:Fur family transcriptional regulator, ferric uptake regulator